MYEPTLDQSMFGCQVLQKILEVTFLVNIDCEQQSRCRQEDESRFVHEQHCIHERPDSCYQASRSLVAEEGQAGSYQVFTERHQPALAFFCLHSERR